MSFRVMFLRSENGFPVGCLAMELNDEARVVTYQMSVLNPKDKFDRKLAREIASERLKVKPILVKVKKGASMYEVSVSVMNDLLLTKGAPKRALKAAKLWLDSNGPLVLSV